ncbi:hypothetical protein [Lactiplantibacillus songbeiensis]|uniref:D-alanyl-D-alanine carboxypeptidase n=1 Tax=Lactiplantibacillus songbeiensis TaxID=2559920 RepID=A0ABW4C3E5_9LACO|nr:hypothetical protein [Lactiplantibacillus songbeiensis]
MKIKNLLTISATVLVTLAMGATTLNANAATTYKRSKITKVSSKAYYSQRQTGKTYQFKGTAKKLAFKANHALKNYTKTTWQASKKTTVTKNGKQYLYYYVKNSRNGATGWVYSKYLKAGKNFQATTATTVTTTTYTPARAGKVYTFGGDNTYVKFSNGQALKTGENYTQTQQRYVYKAGKKYLYYFVTSADKKVSGWTWHGYLKADSSADTKTDVNSSSQKDSTVNDDTSLTDSNADSNKGSSSSESNIIKIDSLRGIWWSKGTYVPGVYINGQLYTNTHNVYDEYNYTTFMGESNGKLVAVGSSDLVDAVTPANGDVLEGDDDDFFSLNAPSDGFNPDSRHNSTASWSWFQYQPQSNDYVTWQLNVKNGNWDRLGVVSDYTSSDYH